MASFGGAQGFAIRQEVKEEEPEPEEPCPVAELTEEDKAREICFWGVELRLAPGGRGSNMSIYIYIYIYIERECV